MDTNKDLRMPYSTVLFRMTLSGLTRRFVSLNKSLKVIQNIQWHEVSRGLSATAELLVEKWNGHIDERTDIWPVQVISGVMFN